MAPSQRPGYHLDLGQIPPMAPSQTRSASSTSASSPIEPPTASGTRFSQSSTGAFPSMSSITGARLGAGSPSHEYGGRLYSRRAREIQASEGLGPQAWGPPTASGLSTPLREIIPESPNDDSFPDLTAQSAEGTSQQSSAGRRARAGTVPSRFPPGTTTQNSIPWQSLSRSSQPSPSSSPFRPGTSSVPEGGGNNKSGQSSAASNLILSRLRAGSMPQRSNFSSSPFGSSIFSSNWNTARDRASTLASVQSDEANSPTQSNVFKDSLTDTDVKTLDYLGLVDAPSSGRAFDFPTAPFINGPTSTFQPSINAPDLSRISSNRLRSYSVNAKEKYAYEDEEDPSMSPYYSGTLTPSAEAAAAALAATQAQIHQHNLDVQAFANQASSSRPRARTAGLLDSPSSRLWRNFAYTPSRLDSGLTASEIPDDSSEYEGLSDAVRAMQLQSNSNATLRASEALDDGEATRALWLGNVPASTTPSSLKVIFEAFGKIESARVLTHKSCGFVNFETKESAVRAKAQYNGKEIFPGAGPIRIGYAKVPSASGTPSANGLYPSPSPDPFVENSTAAARGNGPTATSGGENAKPKSGAPSVPKLRDLQAEIVQIVREFGANEEEQMKISGVVEQATKFHSFEKEVPTVPEPSHTRIHDAPKLREIRKRIDNNACTQAEIEEIALNMLPEIAELSADYLGNTVVQKLFEYCQEGIKEQMLHNIGPHLAEIGIHKNGTWAAQKIIDVARTPTQLEIIVESLRPYGVALFLDQYGNYVMQCCLRFQAPWNSFVFEIMLGKLWEIAQGRFGARAMRACLESHHASRDQQRMLAAAVSLYSVQLATNSNGALLLTWLLDTCTFQNRRKVLAPRLVPHLVHLCTHKVAYLTVLKVINQRNEPEARDTILQALFFSPDDAVLTEILKDQNCGATLIFKILTTPFFDENIRSDVVQRVRKVLLQLKALPSQGYKRLLDEVGLSARSGTSGTRDTTPGSDQARPGSKHGGHPAQFDRQLNGSYFGAPVQAQPQYTPNMPMQQQLNLGIPTNSPYNQFNVSNGSSISPQTYSPNPELQSPMMGTPNQMAYQQSMLGGRPGVFNYPPPVMNSFSNQVPQPMDAYRNVPRQNQHHMAMGPSPVMPPAGFNSNAGFGNMMGMGVGSPSMWQQQYPNPYMMPQQQLHGQANMGSGGRRGRR